MDERWSTTTASVIGTPRGDYTPVTDDLEKEVKAAARTCDYGTFRVFVDGNEVGSSSQLQTNSLAALNAPIRIEPYDKAGS